METLEELRKDPRLAERYQSVKSELDLCRQNLSQKSQDWAKLTADNNAIKHRAQELGWVWTEGSTVVDAVNFLLIRYDFK